MGGAEETLVERGAWGNQLEFLLTCIGYAVGLGNVWRFPYLAYANGGGAFLLPFILMLIFIGLPVFFLELCLGQFASLGPITLWKMSPLFKGLGFAMAATSWLMSMYYVIIVAWAFFFLFASFTSEVPWSECGQNWNTNSCVTGDIMKSITANETFRNITLEERNLTSTAQLKTPSEEYFYNRVLQLDQSEGIHDLGNVVWELALCLLLAWVTIFLVLLKGIQSLGKVVYFVSLFPYLMLTILVIRGATLDGAAQGVEYYIKPELSKLGNPTVWSEAATMVFFSLSECTGGLIAMSSYSGFRNKCLKDSIIVVCVTGFTCLYAGFAIFSVLGFMAKQKGVDIDQVAAQGPGLVFVVYPEALSQMPITPLWAILFFFMLLTLGFSSMFSYVETGFTAIMDEFPHIFRVNKYRPIMLRGALITCYYLITLTMVTQGGFYLFSLTDNFVSGFPLLIVGLAELAVVNGVYGYSNFAEDIKLMLGKKPNIFFKACWVVISPLILFGCVILKAVNYVPYNIEGYPPYPGWGQALGWLQVSFILLWLPLVAAIVIWKNGNLFKVIKDSAKPDRQWGPAKEEDRKGTKYDREEDLSLEVMSTAVLPPHVYTGTTNGGPNYPLQPRDAMWQAGDEPLDDSRRDSTRDSTLDTVSGSLRDSASDNSQNDSPPPQYEAVGFENMSFKF